MSKPTSVNRHPDGTSKPYEIRFHEFEGTEEERYSVIGWYAGRWREFIRSGSRSVFLDADPAYYLKIKGAGRPPGFEIRFWEKHATGPVSYRFDYEGRKMVDVAVGHDAAFEGGMTYQQASVEFAASRHLARIGYRVVPCIGWGEVINPDGGEPSFFAVLRWRKDYERADKSATPATRRELLEVSARTLVEVHFLHHIASYFSNVRADGRYYLYDLHPTRMISRLTDSSISATMTMLYNLHVRWYTLKSFCLLEEDESILLADELFRAVLPDATYPECRHLMDEVLLEMFRTDNFSGYQASLSRIRSNRISSAILDRFRESIG